MLDKAVIEATCINNQLVSAPDKSGAFWLTEESYSLFLLKEGKSPRIKLRKKFKIIWSFFQLRIADRVIVTKDDNLAQVPDQ